MQSSLEQQRASVRRQAKSAGAAIPPWPEPPIITVMAEPPSCDPLAQPELTALINEAAAKQNLDPSIIREVARKESGFRPCAVSSKGAEGLMQLMPMTQLQFQVTDPFNAKESIEAGTKLLKQLLERYHGDLALALSAYNAGTARVDKAGGIPEIFETQNYVSTILNRLQ